MKGLASPNLSLTAAEHLLQSTANILFRCKAEFRFLPLVQTAPTSDGSEPERDSRTLSQRVSEIQNG